MDEEPLVRAMPRRLLYALRGFISKIDLEVLSAVDDEGWCATRSAIEAEIDCKEARLGVVVIRRTPAGVEALVAEGGRLLTVSDIGPEVAGLGGLKQLAKRVAATASGDAAKGVELAGYLNDDVDPALRKIFHLIYRATAPPTAAAPTGTVWVAKSGLAQAGLDALSARVIDAVA